MEECWGLNGSGEKEDEEEGGQEEKEGELDAGCLLFLFFFFLKARFSPDTSVLFINSFSRAVKNQCALHCKQFIMMGDGRRGRGGVVGVGARKKKAQLQQN